MRTAGLRTGPVDRRYLRDKDNTDYNNSGEYAERASALSRARQYRGQIAYQQNRPKRTVTSTPGTGSTYTKGQAQRNRKSAIAAQNSRSAGLRSDIPVTKKPDTVEPLRNPLPYVKNLRNLE